MKLVLEALVVICLALLKFQGCHGNAERGVSPLSRVQREVAMESGAGTSSQLRGNADLAHASSGDARGQAQAKLAHVSNIDLGYNSREGLVMKSGITNEADGDYTITTNGDFTNKGSIFSDGFLQALLQAIGKIGQLFGPSFPTSRSFHSDTRYFVPVPPHKRSPEQILDEGISLLEQLEFLLYSPRPRHHQHHVTEDPRPVYRGPWYQRGPHHADRDYQ